jgi:hypothetical protein
MMISHGTLPLKSRDRVLLLRPSFMNAIQGPNLSTRHHRPYYTPEELDILSEKQRGRLSINQDEKERQRACSLMDAVGTRMGLLVE